MGSVFTKKTAITYRVRMIPPEVNVSTTIGTDLSLDFSVAQFDVMVEFLDINYMW